ncbi:O-antigen/teichoic acid export membrane protein [Pacificibacter maritimus]|uniref:O-antigen/teichoic acid export membrane protein n=2 Tax=Pacificibacter maritimus TaxID=762213 RepID=A0A3N4UN41_9RHOB|nr:O-antigen/teichoic acid export membrane protein [Pacificibacter maritimus]
MGRLMTDTKRASRSPLIIASAIGGLYKFAGVGLAFLVLLVLAKQMTPVEFGIYSIGFSIASAAWSLATVGQPVSVVRFWPTLEEKYDTATANFVLIRGLKIVSIGAALMLAAFGVISLLDLNLGAVSASSSALLWTGLFTVALAYSQFLCFALRAQGLLNWSLVPRDILWRAGVIVIALAAGDLTGVQGIALTGLVLTTVTLAQLIKMLRIQGPNGEKFQTRRPPQEEIAKMQSAQWGLYGVNIARQWLQQAATIVVAIVLGPVAAGAFFAAQRLANLLSLVLVGTNQVSGPMIARDWHAGRKDDLQKLITAVVVFTAATSVLGLIFFGAFGGWMLSQFDPSYRNVYWALIAMACGQLVNSACGPNGNLLNLAGEERSLLKVSVVSGIANIIFTAGGAYFGGVLGAAIGTAMATVLWNLWATLLCARKLGILLVHPSHLRNVRTTLKEVIARKRGRKGKTK